MKDLTAAAGLGAATGMRSMQAAAWMAHALPDHRVLGDRRVTAGLTVLAAGELIGDKLPFVPDRIDPGPLGGRIVIGALLGYVAAPRRPLLGLLVGGAAAAASTWLAWRVRRDLTKGAGLPDLPVALAEDALSLSLARTYSRQVSSHSQ